MNNISIDYNIKTFGNDSSNDYQPEILFVNETGDSFYLKEPKS